MYNLRYHIASLVAVFLALSVGLVLGSIVVERGTLDEQREALVTSLQQEFTELNAENKLLKARVEAEPDAELFIHPECGCATSALYLVTAGVVPADRVRVLSTGGMVDAARETTAAKVRVATETGMIHQLHKVNSTTDFVPVNRAAVCKYMKMITPAKLLRSLREGTDEVFVDRDIADRARVSVERMIAIGTPSATAE